MKFHCRRQRLGDCRQVSVVLGLQTSVSCLGTADKSWVSWRHTGNCTPMADGTTVPRAWSTVLPPLQKPRPDYSSAPSSEKPEGTTVPRTCSTVLPLLREARRQQWPHGATLQEQLWSNQDLKITAFIQTAGLIN